jgi:4-hydroxy-tetrahydrodipicolinate synthase
MMARIVADEREGRGKLGNAEQVIQKADGKGGPILVMTGLFAAVATPIHDDGRFDEAGFDRLVDFLVGAGVDGICIGGATGEYPHFETADRKAVIRRAGQRLLPDRTLLVGIGSSSTRGSIELGQAAIAAGSGALLLPMPMFFRYQQEDLQAFAAHVSRALRAPCLLYDLPDFTNGLSQASVLSLLHDEEFIVGIKDSSGREENLATFAGARGKHPWTLLVGDDRLLGAGLQAGWDGGISGVAGCCPELLVSLVRSARDGRSLEAAALQALLDELIARLSVFPTPWGIRIALEARGFPTGPLPLPLTQVRRRQILDFQIWFRAWLAERAGAWLPRGAA